MMVWWIWLLAVNGGIQHIQGLNGQDTVTTYENETANLMCNHGYGNPTDLLSIYWYRPPGDTVVAYHLLNGNKIIQDPRLQGRASWTGQYPRVSLHYSRVLVQDDDRYKCQVQLLNGQFKDFYLNLTVYVRPGAPKITHLSNPVIEGDVTIGCQVNRVKPVDKIQMYWTLEGNSTQHPGTEDSRSNGGEKTFTVYNNATINIGRKYDGQNIACHSKWENVVTGTDSKQLDMKYPPKFTTLTANGGLVQPENTVVSMTCNIGGGAKPPPTLTFYQLGKPSPLQVNQSVSTGATYRHTLKKEDNGINFFCNATGKAEVIKTPVMSNKIKYDVTYPAGSVSVTGISGPVKENSSVTLQCVATNGNPDVYTYKWSLRRNGEVEPLPRTGSTLVYAKIKYYQAGDYICEAINMAGSKRGEATLIVHYAPKLDPDRRTKTELFPKAGTTAVLSLYVTALPVPVTFEWSKDSLIIVENINSDNLTSNLTLINVTQSQFGSYICKATNNIASTIFVFSVKGQQKPLRPEDVTVVYASAVSLRLRWKRNFDGGFKQHFRVKYKKQGDSGFTTDPANITDPYPKDYAQHKLNQSLTANTVYQVVVVAVTAFEGTSETESNPLTARTKARPEINADKLTVDRRGSDARLTWTIPTGQYTHYVIEWCEKPDKTKCESETEGNETVSTTISGLRDGQEYSFVMKVYDGEDLVKMSPEFTPKGGSGSMVVIAIVVPICLIAAIVTSIIVGIMVIRRHKAGGSGTRQKKDAEMNGSSHLMSERRHYNGAGGIDNQALSTSTPDLIGDQKNGDKKPPKPTKPKPSLPQKPSEGYTYAEVNKPKKGAKAEAPAPGGPVYAQVEKKNKKDAAQPEGPVYAQVEKQNKKKDKDKDKDKGKTGATDIYAQPDKKKKDKKGEKKDKKGAEGEMLYENVRKDASNDEGENPYQNVEQTSGRPQNVGPDGTVYAELEILKKPVPSSSDDQTVHRKEEPVEYAAIDFNRRAPPPEEEAAENKANEKTETKDNLV